jgi:hypothetical protein
MKQKHKIFGSVSQTTFLSLNLELSDFVRFRPYIVLCGVAWRHCTTNRDVCV